MPDVPISQIGEDFRFAAKHHCMGLYFDMFWYHWANQGPLYYALAHLAWDPQTDLDALMEDYHTRAYGPAAADLKAYWDLLERTRMEFVAANPSRRRAFNLPDKYTPELFAEARVHLDNAAAKVESGDERYRRRLHFTRCGLEFAETVVVIRAAMREFEAGEGKEEAAKARVLAQWEGIAAMREEFPPFAINWNAVFREPRVEGDPNVKRVEGLHPLTPINARTLRELQAEGLE